MTLGDIGTYVGLWAGGMTFWAAVGHAVNTCPAPDNKWWRWGLGCIQFLVGQRIAAANTVNGLQTMATAVTRDQKAAIVAGHVQLEMVDYREGD